MLLSSLPLSLLLRARVWRRGLIGSNRGELANGWYSRISQEGPSAAPAVAATAPAPATRDLEVRRPEKKKPRLEDPDDDDDDDDDESEDEVVGPFLPGQAPKRAVKPGPAIPTEDDLHMQRGAASVLLCVCCGCTNALCV